jgi:hypothetical protein
MWVDVYLKQCQSQKSDEENAKKTETKHTEGTDDNENNDNKDNKDNKVNENLNKYQLGGKYVEKTEVIKELDEKFKGKYDFSKLDDEAFELYYNFLKDAKDGENKKSWQKSMGERENSLANEKKKIAQQLTDLQQKEADYRAEVKRLKDVVEEDVDDDDDLTETERIRKITAQERAEERLIDLEKENKQNENARIKLQFYRDHNDLAEKYPLHPLALLNIIYQIPAVYESKCLTQDTFQPDHYDLCKIAA